MPTFLDFLAPLARAGITWISRRSLPQTDGIVQLSGLTGSAEVIRDRWGIPHIYATSSHDLFFAQGFIHAQDRLWQLEMNRRTAQGRLSELFGDLALDTDRAVRTFGFNRLGNTDLENSEPEVHELLAAYAEGINAFLNRPSTKLPVEFTLLGHRPEPWAPEDSAAISRLMIWQLSHAWYGEIVQAQVIQAVGEGHAAELSLQYPQVCPVTLPTGIEYNALDPDSRLEKTPGPFLDRGKGSNTWAVSGWKSATGKPVLCNDMHLALSLPAIWYEMHLNAGALHVSGVSLPGVPLVLVGHNANIAWGMTLAYTDSEDLFVEKVDPQEPHKILFKGEWEEAQVIQEPIQVKGRAQPHLENVFITRHGPIISDVVGYPEQRLAVCSMALRPCPALKGWYLLNLARDWGEFVEAMRRIEAPQLSVSYADVEGNIGYWVAGKVPVRAKGSGDLPAPGWDGSYEWTGEIPFEEMPHVLNPRNGYVVNCNNKIIPEDYPHFLGNVWMNGYRASRIDAVLQSKKELSIDDFSALHQDFTCLPGLEFVAHLDGIDSDDPEVRRALELLRAWDGQLTPGSVGGTVYEVTRSILIRSLLEPGLGKELTVKVLGEGFHPLLFFASELYGNDTVTLFRMLDNPDSWWVRQAGGREAAILSSLRQAVEWLRGKLGPDAANWQWGKIHQINFAHALSLQKPLDQVFNLGPFPIGGDTDTVCQTASLPGSYLNNAWSPSVRFIFDLGDLPRSLAVYPPGQSGQLGSPHYDDLLEPWLKGKYHPVLWTREQVEQEAMNRLVLENS